MSDIKKVLTDEIRRLAKKEIKIALEPLHAKISALKKQVAELSKAGNLQKKEAEETQRTEEKPKDASPKVRINAAGIKKLREKLNMTQDAIAAILEVSKPAYCTWEQGKKIPARKTKLKIAILRKLSPAQAKKILAAKGIKQGTPRRFKNEKKAQETVESQTNA